MPSKTVVPAGSAGVWLTSTGRLVTPLAGGRTARGSRVVNDGRWHHLLVTRAGATVFVYLDGALAYRATTGSPQAPAKAVWQVGGPARHTSVGAGPLVASVDELAIVGRGVSAREAKMLFSAAKRVAPARPRAVLSVSVSGRTARFSGARSTDADGRVVAYEWEFGDGTTARGPSPTRVYERAGTYIVQLRVTDSDGNVHAVSQAVTVR